MNSSAEYYDRIAESYDRVLNLRMLLAGGEAGFYRTVARRAKSYLLGDVLEACCGPGSFTRYLAEICPDCRIEAIDHSEQCIRTARQKVRSPKVTFSAGDVAALAFADLSFDAAVVSMAFHELEPDLILRALAELKRVLRPGGHVVLIEHHLPEHPWARMFYDMMVVAPGEHPFVERFHGYGLERCLAESGLHVREQQVLFAGCIQIVVASPGTGAQPPVSPKCDLSGLDVWQFIDDTRRSWLGW